MALFNAHKFEIRILDEKLKDPDELLLWVCEAISMYCEVHFVEGIIIDFKEAVVSLEGLEIAEA
jgi:hypothetical protein